MCKGWSVCIRYRMLILSSKLNAQMAFEEKQSGLLDLLDMSFPFPLVIPFFLLF